MKKKILSLLVLLAAAASGAWADELSESFTTNTEASVYTGEHFKITPENKGDGDGFALNSGYYATIEALNGETITKVELTRGFSDINRFHCEVGTTTISGDVATVSDVNNTSLTFNSNPALQIKAVKVYYTVKPFDYAFTEVPADHGSGKIAFFIGGKKVDGAYAADAGKEVTMTVTPDEGWTVDNANVTVATPYTDWESAGARRMYSGPTKVDILNTVPLTYVSTDAQGVATFTFSMPASSVRVKGAYKKVSTLYFDPAGKTELMEIKVGDDKVNVKDSKTVKIEKVERVLEGTPVNLKANLGYKFRKVEVKKGKPEAPEYADKLTEISGDNALNGVASINETITRDQALALAQYLASQTGTDCLVMYGAKPTSPNPSATVSAVDNNGNNRSVYYKKAISSSEQTGLSAYGNKVYYVAQ